MSTEIIYCSGTAIRKYNPLRTPIQNIITYFSHNLL